MNAAARVVGRDVVAGRGDLLRGGRGREGGGADRRALLAFLSCAAPDRFGTGTDPFAHGLTRARCAGADGS